MINRKRFGYALAGMLALTPLALADAKKIVVTGMPGLVQSLQGAAPDVTLVAAEGPELMEQVGDADAIFGTITPELFHAGKKLKWVQIYSAGVELYRFPEFIKSDVVLTNCKILQAPWN